MKAVPGMHDSAQPPPHIAECLDQNLDVAGNVGSPRLCKREPGAEAAGKARARAARRGSRPFLPHCVCVYEALEAAKGGQSYRNVSRDSEGGAEL